MHLCQSIHYILQISISGAHVGQVCVCVCNVCCNVSL